MFYSEFIKLIYKIVHCMWISFSLDIIIRTHWAKYVQSLICILCNVFKIVKIFASIRHIVAFSSNRMTITQIWYTIKVNIFEASLWRQIWFFFILELFIHSFAWICCQFKFEKKKSIKIETLTRQNFGNFPLNVGYCNFKKCFVLKHF